MYFDYALFPRSEAINIAASRQQFFLASIAKLDIPVRIIDRRGISCIGDPKTRNLIRRICRDIGTG